MSNFTIVQLTDLHLRPPGLAAYRVCESNMLTERALRAVGRLKPDAVMITGDLTDCGLPAEYEVLAGLIRRHLPCPVHVIPGNHDRRPSYSPACKACRRRTGSSSMPCRRARCGW